MKLVHIDLTCTGLTDHVVYELGRAIRRSVSLMAIHLSGNPGLSTENKEYLHKRIHARPHEDMSRFIKINKLITEILASQP
jgi:hypothetical protein